MAKSKGIIREKRSGLSYIAWLAAEHYIEDFRADDVKEYAYNYLTAYTDGVLLDDKTVKKFYDLVAINIELSQELV